MGIEIKDLFHYADEYVKECDWKDMALLKTCLCSLGIVIGTLVPKQKKKPVFIITSLVFLATYIPIMFKFVRSVLTSRDKIFQ